MSGSESEFIDTLIRRLERLGTYRDYRLHVPYHSNRGNGEMDVVAVRRDGRGIDYYEVKTSNRGMNKADRQLRRAKLCNSNLVDTYIYIGLEDRIVKDEI